MPVGRCDLSRNYYPEPAPRGQRTSLPQDSQPKLQFPISYLSTSCQQWHLRHIVLGLRVPDGSSSLINFRAVMNGTDVTQCSCCSLRAILWSVHWLLARNQRLNKRHHLSDLLLLLLHGLNQQLAFQARLMESDLEVLAAFPEVAHYSLEFQKLENQSLGFL